MPVLQYAKPFTHIARIISERSGFDMQTAIFSVCLLLTITLVGIGCSAKSEPTTTGEPTPEPNPNPNRPEPKPKGGIPLSKFPYDPTKPEHKISLAKFKSPIPASDPTAKDWLAKNGKVGEVHGIMGYLFAAPRTRHEAYNVRSETESGSIACESLFPPDWRAASPGRVVTVVGVIEALKQGDGVQVRLKDAHVMAIAPGRKNMEATAEELGELYTLDRAAFDRKWKAADRYTYVTGTLKRIDKVPNRNGELSNKFILAAGSVELYCHIQNERGVKANPPKAGDKVTVLVNCSGYDSNVKGIAMNGVYVDRGEGKVSGLLTPRLGERAWSEKRSCSALNSRRPLGASSPDCIGLLG